MGGANRAQSRNPPPKPERNAEIARRHKAGESAVALAAEYGLTPSRIRGIVREGGLPAKKRGRPKGSRSRPSPRSLAILADHAAGLTMREIAAKHGVSKQWVWELLGRAGVKVERSP